MHAAASIIRYYRFFLQRNAKNVLDYGAGWLRNSLFLSGEGFKVFAADLPEQIWRLERKDEAGCLAGLIEVAELEQTALNVDLVISNFVLNIIPDGLEKQRYLSNIVRNLRPEGYLLVEVRCRQGVPVCDNGCSCPECSSCVKAYSHAELDLVLAPYRLRRICHYYRHCSLAAIYQLKGTVG